MNEHQLAVAIEPDEDGFHAYVPGLPGCHTFGMTLEEAQANILEAAALHIECMLEDGEAIPSGALSFCAPLHQTTQRAQDS